MANKYTEVDDAGSERWKRKYYDILDELEKKENKYQKIESLLRNAVTRISLGVETENSALTRQLDGLRDAIRNGHDTLKLRNIIETISDLIKTTTTKPESKSEHTIESALHGILEKIEWPKAAKEDKKRIAKDYATIRDSDIDKFSNILTKLINRTFSYLGNLAKENTPDNVNAESADKDKEPEKINETGHTKEEIKSESENDQTLDRILGSMLLTLLNKIPETAIDTDKVRVLKLQATKCQQREQALAIIDGIADALVTSENPSAEDLTESDFDKPLAASLLIQFLEQIILPDDLGVRAEQLREKLINNQTEAEILDTLEGCIEIVTQMQIYLRDERKELENFLLQVSTRLQEIDEQLKSLAGVSEAQRESVESVNKEVEKTTAEIERALTNEEDLDALKSTVKSHVIMIRHHLDTYFDGEATRNQGSDRIVKQLASELLKVRREADELRVQLEKRRLEATHDPLTRIPNRLAYQEWIDQEHYRFTKYDTPFVLMVWDVDFFKKINDNYGHLAGDKVLRIVAQMLAEQVREADFVARFGGEEFVVVMPGTTQQPAMQVAEKIRKALSECAFHFREEPVSITASCGVAEIRAGESTDELFQRADEALYSAKQGGRNRCVSA